MKCKNFKIWLDGTGGKDINSLSSEMREHLNSCESCSKNYRHITIANQIIESQKLQEISRQKENQILNSLLKNEPKGRIVKIKESSFFITKIAAILIIALGVLLGVIAGNYFFKVEDNTESSWDNEFALVSESSDYSLFE